MHCELLVPGLLSAVTMPRAVSLELLLARGRRSSADAATPEAWLFEGFGAQQQAAGAFSLLGAGSEPGTASWARADPVHLRLLRDRVVVMPAEALPLSLEEAGALAGQLETVAEMKVLSPRRWCLRLPAGAAAGAKPAIEAAGEPAPLARDSDRLLTEIQMTLHAHPANEARETRGEPAVNSVWLWGGGALERLESSRWHSVFADDPLPLGLARAAGARPMALPADGAGWLARAPEEGRHLIVLDALRAPAALSAEDDLREALERLERDWFAPLLSALREGRVGMVTIHVPDGGAASSFEIVRGDLRRFWRRPRALGQYT